MQFLADSEMLPDAQTILEATDDHMKMTPLHVAALNTDPKAARLNLFND